MNESLRICFCTGGLDKRLKMFFTYGIKRLLLQNGGAIKCSEVWPAICNCIDNISEVVAENKEDQKEKEMISKFIKSFDKKYSMFVNEIFNKMKNKKLYNILPYQITKKILSDLIDSSSINMKFNNQSVNKDEITFLWFRVFRILYEREREISLSRFLKNNHIQSGAVSTNNFEVRYKKFTGRKLGRKKLQFILKMFVELGLLTKIQKNGCVNTYCVTQYARELFRIA